MPRLINLRRLIWSYSTEEPFLFSEERERVEYTEYDFSSLLCHDGWTWRRKPKRERRKVALKKEKKIFWATILERKFPKSVPTIAILVFLSPPLSPFNALTTKSLCASAKAAGSKREEEGRELIEMSGTRDSLSDSSSTASSGVQDTKSVWDLNTL